MTNRKRASTETWVKSHVVIIGPNKEFEQKMMERLVKDAKAKDEIIYASGLRPSK